jgi:hypothetical protein
LHGDRFSAFFMLKLAIGYNTFFVILKRMQAHEALTAKEADRSQPEPI